MKRRSVDGMGHNGRMRTGIVFLRTRRLAELVSFYRDRIGCGVWMDQDDCVILNHGPFLFGFCQRGTAQTDALLTFVYSSRGEVDHMYSEHRDSAEGPPAENPRYPIYNFFARDPEGRPIEFQVFTNDPDAPL